MHVPPPPALFWPKKAKNRLEKSFTLWEKTSHFGKKLHTLGKNFILWEKTSHFGKKLHTLGMNFTVHSGKNFTLWEITSHFGNELHTSLPVFLWPFWPFLALKAVFELKHSLFVGIPVKM